MQTVDAIKEVMQAVDSQWLSSDHHQAVLHQKAAAVSAATDSLLQIRCVAVDAQQCFWVSRNIGMSTVIGHCKLWPLGVAAKCH